MHYFLKIGSTARKCVINVNRERGLRVGYFPQHHAAASFSGLTIIVMSWLHFGTISARRSAASHSAGVNVKTVGVVSLSLIWFVIVSISCVVSPGASGAPRVWGRRKGLRRNVGQFVRMESVRREVRTGKSCNLLIFGGRCWD